ETQEPARTQRKVILQLAVAPIEQTRDHTVLVDAQPRTVSTQVLTADDMGPFDQGGRGQGRARQVFIAIRGYDYGIVRDRLEIDCEGTHGTNLTNQRATTQGLAARQSGRITVCLIIMT